MANLRERARRDLRQRLQGGSSLGDEWIGICQRVRRQVSRQRAEGHRLAGPIGSIVGPLVKGARHKHAHPMTTNSETARRQGARSVFSVIGSGSLHPNLSAAPPYWEVRSVTASAGSAKIFRGSVEATNWSR